VIGAISTEDFRVIRMKDVPLARYDVMFYGCALQYDVFLLIAEFFVLAATWRFTNFALYSGRCDLQ